MFLYLACVVFVKCFESFPQIIFEDHVVYIKRRCQEIMKIYHFVALFVLSFGFFHNVVQWLLIFFLMAFDNRFFQVVIANLTRLVEVLK